MSVAMLLVWVAMVPVLVLMVGRVESAVTMLLAPVPTAEISAAEALLIAVTRNPALAVSVCCSAAEALLMAVTMNPALSVPV